MKSKVFNLFLSIVTVIFVAGYLQTVMGCAKQFPSEPTSIISADLDTQVRLGIHQIAVIKPEEFRVEFLELTEDSRCPSDVACIQEGQVTATFNIEGLRDGQANDYFISLTQRASQAELAIKNFDGYSIQLVNVAPYPTSTEEIATSDYVVTIVVSQL